MVGLAAATHHRLDPAGLPGALAGLSLGGLQTYNVLFSQPGQFRYGGTSARVLPPDPDAGLRDFAPRLFRARVF